MNLTTQLRIILLLVGAAIWLGIYLLGKRSAAPRAAAAVAEDELPKREAAVFAAADEIDEEELETPAYMRRQGQRDARQDYEPRIANVDDYGGAAQGDHQLVDIAVHSSRRDVSRDRYDTLEASHANAQATTPTLVEPVFADSLRPQSLHNSPAHDPIDEPVATTSHDEPMLASRREPRVSFDDAFEVAAAPASQLSTAATPDVELQAEPSLPTAASMPETVATPVPVAAEPVVSTQATRAVDDQYTSRQTPTLSEVVSKPAPVSEPPRPTTTSAAGQSNKSVANDKPVARRKIVALRLPMPERVAGEQLLTLLQREQLQHGKFSIFHRMHGTQAVFSIASMVEPGTFDPAVMATQQFPGVTLFMQLPGPLDGLIAYDQMMSCAQRIAHATGGTLQDERGSKLTPSSTERLREEVLDFQHLIGGVTAAH
jgi:FtsZ-interacting cell division protein ZipA